jgi:NADH:ubiquinone oxidoreductase subunit E
MIEVKICVGSCCFSQGAGEIIKFYEESLVKEMPEVSLSGSFCLGNCGKGVSISLRDELYKVESVEDFKQLIIKALNEQ